MNNISITPKGGTVASEVSGSQVNLTAPSVVKLHLNQSDIKSFTRNGNDLVVTTKSGEVVVIHNFYTAAGDSDLVLQDDKGALWWVEDPGTDGFQYVNIDSTEGLLAENTTNDGTIAAFGIGGAALAGLGAMFAGSSGGGGGNAAVDDGNTGGGDNGGGNNGGGNNGGGNNGGGNNGGGDTTAPTAATNLTLTDNVGAIQGAIVNGVTTDDNTPTLTGTAEAGATVSIYDGSTLLGTVVVGANGNWSFTSPALAEGQHSFTTTVTDAAGNTSGSSDPITFIVDTVAPVAAAGLVVSDDVGGTQGPLTAGSTTDDNTPTISGTAEPGTYVSVYDGTTLLGTATVGADGTWSFTTPALSNGAHSLTVTVTDTAGNVSAATDPFNFSVTADLPPATSTLEINDDNGPALVPLTNGAYTNDNTPVLSGLTTVGAVVTLYDGAVVLGSVVAGTDGQWVFTPSALADGSHAIHATITDATGNSTSSVTITINIDTVVPDTATNLALDNNDGSTLVPIVPGDATNDSTPSLSGTAEPGSVVTVRDGDTVLGSVTVGGNGSWTFTSPTLTDGAHSLTATVTDRAGNVSPASEPLTFTVDTVAPAAASELVVTDNVGEATGPLASGETTDDNTLDLSGQAEEGSVVRIYDGLTLLGSVTTGVGGSWNFTTAPLTNGSHSLTVTVTDAAGNVSQATPPFEVNVEADLPPATLTLEVTDDSGNTLVALADGASTQDTTPVLSGLAVAGAVVTLTDGSTVLGSVIADSDGQWTFTPDALPDGPHAFQSSYVNATGNTIESDVITVTIDTVAPLPASGIELRNDADVPIADGGSTNDTTPQLNGNAEPGSTVTVSDGTTVLGTTTVGEDGTWTYTLPPLTDGPHNITTTVTDPAGNTSPASDPIAVVIDTLPPAAAENVQLSSDLSDTLVPVTTGATNDTTPVLSGTAEAGSTVTISDNGTLLGTVTVDTNGNWSYTPTLTPGDHSLTTVVTDPAGNTSSASAPINVNVDTTAPEAAFDIQLSNDQSGTAVLITGETTNDSTPVISGRAEPGSTVTISDGNTVLGSVSVRPDGSWSYTTSALAEGTHSLTTTVTDLAGNTSPASAPVAIIIDVTAPLAATDVSLANDDGDAIVVGGATNDTTPVLSGSAEPGSTVNVLDGTTIIGTATVGEDGNWTFSFEPALAAGEHSLSVTVTDPAGNTGPASSAINFTIDTTAPDAAINLQLSNNEGGASVAIVNGGATNDTTPVLSGAAGSAEPGSIVTVYDNDAVTPLGTTTVAADGSWSFTLPALDAGEHSLTVTLTDPAGNVSDPSESFAFSVDLTAPDAATAITLANDGGTAIPAGGATNDSSPVLNGAAGSAEANSVITVSDGLNVLGTAVVGADGSWSFTLPTLSDGAHSLTTTVTDPAGNVSEPSVAIGFIVDTVLPDAASDLVLSSDQSGAPVAITNGTTNDTTPVLSGTAEAGATVTVYADGVEQGSTIVGDNGTWTFTSDTPLETGEHRFTTTVTDLAGNIGPESAPVTLIIDTTAPDTAINLQLTNDQGTTPVTITNGGATNDTTPVLSGSALAGSVVTISDGSNVLGSVAVGANGNWSYTLPALDSGTDHSLTTVVTDPSGNRSEPSAPITFSVDTEVPDAALNLALANDSSGTAIPVAAGGVTNDNTPLLTGTAEANSTITVSDGDTLLGTTTADANGDWSFTPALTDGAHSLSVTVTDAAGNTSVASAPVTVTIDTVAPSITNLALSNDQGDTPVAIPSGGLTNDSTPVVSGSAEEGTVITLTEGTTVLGQITVDATGNWSIAVTSALSEGPHTINITARDPAGNTSAPYTLSVEVDTTPLPAATGIILSTDNGTAPVTNAEGTFTSDSTPLLSGSATAGSIINVYNGDTLLGTTTVGSDGAWTFTLPNLTDDTYTLSVRVVDAAGNLSPATEITFTVDTDVPPVATLQVFNNDGTTNVEVQAGGSTNDNTPLLSGTAEAGSLVIIYDANQLALGSTIALDDGTWSFQSPILSEGAHTLTATVTDEIGNVSSPSTSFTISVDITAPEPVSALLVQNDADPDAPVTLTNGGATNDTTPAISGNAEPGSTVSIINTATGEILGTAVADAVTGAWVYTTTTAWAEGTYNLGIVATDNAGNASASTNFTLTIDNTAPDVGTFTVSNNNGANPVGIPVNTTTNDSTPELRGTGSEAGAIIAVYSGDILVGSAVVAEDGTWSVVTSVLSEGPQTLSVTATDAAGNNSAASTYTLSVDTLAPEAPAGLTVTDNVGDTTGDLLSGATTDDNSPAFGGTAEPGSIVSVYDGTALLGTVIADATTGAWTFSPDALSNGLHNFTATATDAAGNVSPAAPQPAFELNIQADLPPATSTLQITDDSGSTLVALTDGDYTRDTSPVLTGLTTANAVVTILDGSDVLGSVTASADGQWTFTPALDQGEHVLSVTVVDAQGNDGTGAGPVTINVDSIAPDAVVNLVVNNNNGSTPVVIGEGTSTNDSTPQLTGTAEAGAIITVYDGANIIGTTTVDTEGLWSFTTSTLTNGAHALSVTVTDLAGNISPASTSVNFIVDTLAPAAATNLVVTNNDATPNTVIPNGGSTNDSTPLLSGLAEANSTVTIYDGTTVLGTVIANGSGNWSYSPELGEGTHVLSVRVTDAAGNVSGASATATVIVDTLPPALTLALSNNNGPTAIPIANNGITNDATPALSGTTDPGSLVIIRENNVVVGSVTASSTGSWSYISAALAEGQHTFSVTATDLAGNVSTAATVTVNVSLTGPAPVTDLIVTDDVAPVTGQLTSGATTNDSTPTLSGTAGVAGNVVTVYDSTTVLGTVIAGADGAWTFTTATLTNGAHSLSVTVTDAAGNTSSATNFPLIVDTVAPTATTLVVTNDTTGMVVPAGGATNDTTPTLSGVAEAGSRISIYDNGVLLGTATAGTNGAWSFTTAALGAGSHPLTATVTDAAGNVSGSTAATVTIDTTAPGAVTVAASNNNGSTPIAIANGGSTNDNTPALSGTAEAGSIVIVREGNTVLGSTTASSSGAWSLTSATLTDGTHNLSVTATDAAGNVSTPTPITLTIDTGVPVAASNLTVTNDSVTPNVTVSSGGSTNDSTPVLSGTSEADAIVTVYDGNTVLGSTTANGSGAWSFTPATALTNGSHALSVTVKDAAGNVSPASGIYTVIVDTIAPTATTLVITNDITGVVVPTGGLTNDTTPTLSGVAEAGSRVSIYDNGVLLGTTTAGTNGAWTFTTAVLGTGSHPLTATVTDAAGNVSGTTSATVIVDTTAPSAVSLIASNNNGNTPVTIPNNGVTNDSTPLLSGTGEAGARISVYEGTTLLGTATVASNGSWSFVTGTLSNGTHTFSVTQTDAAGNVSPAASTTLLVDTVAPSASTLTIIDDAGTTPVTLANGAYTRDTTPVLSGTAEVGAVVTIFDGATALGSVTVGAGGTWTFTPAALSNGAHTLSTTVTDSAGNVSTGNTTATVNVDTVAPAAVSGLAINTAGTVVTGSGEVGATVTVRDAGGAAIGTATVGTGGTWSVSLTTAQITGATLSVTQTDRAGNVSTSTPLVGAIRVVATNDTNEVDYSTTQGTINNGTTSVSHVALANVGLGSVLNATVLSNGNAYVFSVGPEDTRTITLNGSVGGISLISTYSLYLYEQQTDGTWLLIQTNGSYLSTGLISLGTQTGANITYSNLGTGNYAVVIGSNVSVGVLPTTTISTVSDITTLAVTVAATVTGNLLTNDTSSIAGTIPTGTTVTAVSGSAVSSSGNTVINTTYGTLTIDYHGDYTYTLKAGLNIDTLPTADTFTYSVRDASGAVTSATLTVTLHNGAATSITVSTLVAETTSAEHDASGSIYGDSSATHTGTLSITNENGDLTTVSSTGTTSVAGEYGVLTIAANGSYTYNLNANVEGQNILHKEVFTYTLAATDGTITTHSFTIDLHPTITGTTGADTITGGAYDDTITTGAGADTLVYHLLATADATGGNGHDTWTDFNVAQGDKVDISNLLIGWNDSTSNINDFVKVDHTSDGNTVLSIDRDGTGTAYSSTQLVTLEGVNVSLEELLQQPHQNTTA